MFHALHFDALSRPIQKIYLKLCIPWLRGQLYVSNSHSLIWAMTVHGWVEILNFFSYVSQILMDFAPIWVIFKLMKIVIYQAQKDQKAWSPRARVLTIQIGLGGPKPGPDRANSLQRGPSDPSPGFEDDDLGNSPCCWAVTAVSYCPSRHLQLTEKT